MVEKIESFLHAADRGERRAVAAYLDIDRFKDINDTLGHDAGDQLIKAVAGRLKARLRPQDFLSRFGGDEFVIFTAPAALQGSAALAERVAQAFASPFAINGQNICMTASVGIALAPDNGVSADELMRHADIALYRAKNTGRDRAVLFTAEMAQEVEHRRSIELALREALESHTLQLNYQPVISCRTGEICGIEALLRWHHPVYGAMSPADFIPIAEGAGPLPALGEWVLERAIRDSTRWPDIEVAINLSPVQFRHLDLEATLRALVGSMESSQGASYLRLLRVFCWRQASIPSRFLMRSARWASRSHSTILGPGIRASPISAISSSIRSRSTGHSSAPFRKLPHEGSCNR